MLLLDKNLVIAEANHAAEDMLGRSIKRLIGMPFVTASGLPFDVATRIGGTESQLVARSVTIARAGGDRKVNLTVSPLTTHPGWKVVTLSDAGQDDMRRDGESQSALKAPAILAHEIKNPLAAIKGASQLLARKVADADTGLTGMIASEVDRIARLIDRMQELGSNSTEQARPVNLHQTIRTAMATVRSAAKDAAELTEAFDPSLPEVLAKQDALEQVLINLLTNAVDACASADSPEVVVRTRFVSGLAAHVGEGGASVRLPVEIAVCDNGKGLDPDLGEHVFEPFVTSKKNGQGLGLALVKKLTNDMGGRVSHKRVETSGRTEFRIHLAVAEQGKS